MLVWGDWDSLVMEGTNGGTMSSIASGCEGREGREGSFVSLPCKIEANKGAREDDCVSGGTRREVSVRSRSYQREVEDDRDKRGPANTTHITRQDRTGQDMTG